MDFFTFHERVSRRAAPEPATPAAKDVLTVAQLTAKIEKALKDQLPGSVHVRGEVSNFKHHTGSGHFYFTLKDAGACLDCVMFKSEAAKLKFTPQDGIELLATGRVGVYGQRGKYQLYATRLEPLGQGALELAFRQLHTKLEAEGLFDAERKRPIPPYPERLVLVTSKQTAAVQDMLKVLRRFPWLSVKLFHVPVQGDGAAEKIAAAVQDINAQAEAVGGGDVILLGRGGGSLEDLWAFNEEVVARAVAASRIPVISGIGHEIDVSIADLVADHHAHTPTEAAQVATANWRNAADSVETGALRLRRETRRLVQQVRQRLAQAERHELFRRPLDRINKARQLLDDRQRALAQGMAGRIGRVHLAVQVLSTRLEQHHPSAVIHRLRARLSQNGQRLAGSTNLRLRLFHDRLGRLLAALGERHPRHALRLNRQRLESASKQLRRAAADDLTRRRGRVETLGRFLEAVGPEQVLKRGYTITTLKKGGALVRSVSDVRVGERLVTRFADGTVESTAEDSKQLSLFE